MARLTALIPRSRANLTRFHGVFAPNSKYRALVTPSKRGKNAKRQTEQSPIGQHAAMTWSQRLKRVFNIDIATCEACGGDVKVIASIEDPDVIKHILSHFQTNRVHRESTRYHGAEHRPNSICLSNR